jgi:hypothetical protein
MSEEHQASRTFIAPSKHVKESTHSNQVTTKADRKMNQWILHHLQCPFLTKTEEDYFMSKYGMMHRQVKTECKNRKQRIIASMRSMKQNDLQE